MKKPSSAKEKQEPEKNLLKKKIVIKRPKTADVKEAKVISPIEKGKKGPVKNSEANRKKGDLKTDIETKKRGSVPDINQGAAATEIKSEDRASKKGKEKDKNKESKKESRKSKKEREQEAKLERVLIKQKPKEQESVISLPKEIEILETVSVGEIAKKLNLKANEIIGSLMKMGMMATINQVLDSETAILLAGELGVEVKIVSLYDETLIEQKEEDRPEDYELRPPVVTIMGHVDHGKTLLLDSIRESNVIAGESGGITQHIGAYQVRVNNKKVTFLDTPGHEAFTMMRSRGASVTDIAIVVVAADDGVMPQTVEAVNHAKEAKVPIIVAVNKIDLESANPEKVRQEISSYGLVPEEWGGDTIFVEISAKMKTNIDKLLEMILIQSEILDLKANPKLSAKGSILEAKLDQGRGPVVSVLVQQGTLSIGDPFVAGIYSGKVRALFNDSGEKVEKVYPSDPVEIIGLSGVPEAGDPFEAVTLEKYAKQICQKRQELKRHEESKKVKKVTLEHLNEMIALGDIKDLKVIIKADVHGSAEALKHSLEKLSNDQVSVQCIHAGTGAINESDVLLAATSNALIIGFHVRPNRKAEELAAKDNVEMKFYNIIYNVVDDIKGAMEGMLDPELREQSEGKGEIREVFKISKIGTIAGGYVTGGKIARSHKIRLIREGEILFDGSFKSIKRFKEDISEVQSGFECGFSLENYNDIQVGDTFETYEIKEVKQKLNKT